MAAYFSNILQVEQKYNRYINLFQNGVNTCLQVYTPETALAK